MLPQRARQHADCVKGFGRTACGRTRASAVKNACISKDGRSHRQGRRRPEAHDARGTIGRQADYDRKDMHGAHIRRRGRGRGHLLSKDDQERGRVRAGRPQRGALDVGVRVRHQLFLGRGVRGLRRPVRMEIRHRRAVGRHRQRHPGQPSCLVGAGAAHARDDAPPGRHHHAGILREAVPVEGPAHCGGSHHLRVPHPVHGERLQRPVAFVRHGVRPALRGMRDRHGGGHLHLCGASAATWPRS